MPVPPAPVRNQQTAATPPAPPAPPPSPTPGATPGGSTITGIMGGATGAVQPHSSLPASVQRAINPNTPVNQPDSMTNMTDPSNPVDYQAYVNQMLGNNPGLAESQSIINEQIQNLYKELGISGQQNQSASDFAQQEAGFSQAGIGLQQQGLASNEQYLGQQQANEQTGYGFTQQGIADQITAARYGLGRSLQDESGSLASTGATSTVGAGRAYGDIANRYAQQLGTNDQLRSLGAKQYTGQLPLEESQAALSHKGAQQGFQNTQRQYDIMSKQLGLSSQEISARLKNTLQQLGLSNQMSADQVMNEIFNVRSGGYSPLSSLLTTVMTQAGIQMPQLNTQGSTTNAGGG